MFTNLKISTVSKPRKLYASAFLMYFRSKLCFYFVPVRFKVNECWWIDSNRDSEGKIHFDPNQFIFKSSVLLNLLIYVLQRLCVADYAVNVILHRVFIINLSNVYVSRPPFVTHVYLFAAVLTCGLSCRFVFISEVIVHITFAFMLEWHFKHLIRKYVEYKFIRLQQQSQPRSQLVSLKISSREKSSETPNVWWKWKSD